MHLGRFSGLVQRAPAVGGRVLAVLLLALTLVVVATPRSASAETGAADPYGMIVMLQVRMPRGEVTCTGFMVGPHTVATAAHCLYNRDMGGWASSAFVTPGIDGLTAPFSTTWATSFTVSPNWIDTQDLDADYGAITLGSDAIGNATGWFDLSTASDYQLGNGLYETAGYGTSLQYGTLWKMPGPKPLVDYDEDFLTYVWGTSAGESGAPIFYRDSENRYRAVGLLKGAFGRSASRLEFAVRVNGAIIDFYREQMARPAAAPVEQAIPTMFSAAAGASVKVTSPVTRTNSESVLQESRDQVTWTTIATQRTDARGVATYVIQPIGTRYYRVVVRGVGTGRVGRGVVTTANMFAGTPGNFATSPTYGTSRTALAVFLGGTTDQLAGALAAAGASAAWVQDAQGAWHVYALDAGFINDPFKAAFPEGIRPSTPMTLVAA